MSPCRDYRFCALVPPDSALISGIRPARNSGRHTPVGHAASSPLRGDFATESATTPRLVNSSHVPFILRPHQNGAEPPTDQLTPIDTTSPPSPAKRSRGRPRKPDEPPGGEIGEFEAQDEPEPETIISALRDLGTVVPFVRLQPVFTYLVETTQKLIFPGGICPPSGTTMYARAAPSSIANRMPVPCLTSYTVMGAPGHFTWGAWIRRLSMMRSSPHLKRNGSAHRAPQNE